MTLQDFITRWHNSGGSERANYQIFLTELCDLLNLPKPDSTSETDKDNAYVFEKTIKVTKDDGSNTSNFIDLYKRDCFIIEAKQGSNSAPDTPLFGKAPATSGKQGHGKRGSNTLEAALQKAKNQAERYARNLPSYEGRPPFILVVDVGYSIEIYSEFSRTGGAYVPYPNPQNYRIFLEDLDQEEHQETLRAIWENPLSLDPARRSAKVTKEIADKLAQLAKSLEADSHSAENVASFLMRVLFTMFAEDVKLLPENSFRDLLESIRGDTSHFKEIVEPLWETMNTGGYSRDLRSDVLRFNGGLFKDCSALPITEPQLELLIEAANADWKDVEPAIFGTLLERALDPQERHKLGAHYTPRAYVDRLVNPTIIEPLRSEYQGVLAAVAQHTLGGEQKDGLAELRKFHNKLCNLRILDPACGSGNFLYVTLEHLKRLEAEVLEAIRSLSGAEDVALDLTGATVTPEQFLGIEINPRAAKIAELVLWIGFLQWQFKTTGNASPPEPVIRDFHNIENKDALLSYDGTQPALDKEGNPKTRWDGRTFKKHPVTGEDVPDETAQIQELEYLNPRKAEWPEADYIVGNPPFIGNKRMRIALGDGYTEALREIYTKGVPNSADFVMYWWDKSAQQLKANSLQSFGLITTNSIKQIFNRKVIENHYKGKNRISITYAIADHPWVDSSDGAAVRIAMTVAKKGEILGALGTITKEELTDNQELELDFLIQNGLISSDLTIGISITNLSDLKSNALISNRGVIPHGEGMSMTTEQAMAHGWQENIELQNHLKPYLNGRDLTQTSRGLYVIDLYPLDISEVKSKFPNIYQWLLERVKPKRDQQSDKRLREKWWLHRRNNEDLRQSINNLKRYIVTIQTSKHRFFVFLDGSFLPDDKLIAIAIDDAEFLGYLSSRIHYVWAIATGGTLEDRPVYNKTLGFDAFPFPISSVAQQNKIRDIAESLDTHRKRQQTQHPKLTMTGMYNVLEQLRSGETLTDKERVIHEQGLVSVLKEIHDDLDAAVFEAYGWSPNLSDEEILEKLVELNTLRAEEEAQGLIRYLRPEYQNPEGTAQQVTIDLKTTKTTKQTATKQAWPKTLPERAQAVRGVVTGANSAMTAKEVAKYFKSAQVKSVTEILETLSALGQVEASEGSYYS